MTLQTLYRPVGLAELLLIEQSGMRRFPKRLPEQPIFYPVLNREYARQITMDWNTKSNAGVADQVGFITEFSLSKDYLFQFDEHQVGDTIHRELWVPAEELEAFNDEIIGTIRVIETYYGEDYPGDGWLIINNEVCFQDNLAVFTTESIIQKRQMIRRVVHDNDGDWQFLPGTNIDNEVPKLVGLGTVVELDRSIREILRLQENQVALRGAVNTNWVVMPIAKATMTCEEAAELLSLHSFTHNNLEHTKMAKGFIGMLKWFDGNLYEENFLEVIAAIHCLSDQLNEERLDRKIVGDILGICQSIWIWALAPDGDYRCDLFSEEQRHLLSRWFDVIFNLVAELVDMKVPDTKPEHAG